MANGNPLGNLKLGGFGTGNNLNKTAKVFSQIRQDMQAIEKSVAAIASSLQQISRSAAQTQGATGQSSGLLTGSGNTGTGERTQMSLAQITASPDFNGRQRTIAGAGAVGQGLFNFGVAGYNDLRIGRDTALEFERSRLIARTGGVQFDKFKDMLTGANGLMTGYNTQDRAILERQAAQAFQANWGAGFGGGAAGMQGAASAVGSLSAMAMASGLSQEAVGAAGQAMYAAPTYYRALASGIATQDTEGNMLSPERILNQYWRRFQGLTPEEVRRELKPTSGFSAELRQTWQDPGLVQMISTSLITMAENGGQVTGEIGDMFADTGYWDNENTQGIQSEAERQVAEERRIGIYTNDVTGGIKFANDQLVRLNDWLSGTDGYAFVSAMESLGGAMDTFNEIMPSTTGKFTDGVAAFASFLGGQIFQKFLGLGSGGGGGAGVAANAAGKGGRWAAVGKGLGKFGAVGLGATSLWSLGSSSVNAASGGLSGQNMGTGDFLSTLALRTAQGAGTGFLFGMNPLSAAIGGAIGLGGGLIEALIKEANDDDSATNDQASTPYGGNGRWEGTTAPNRADIEAYEARQSTYDAGRPGHSEGEFFVEKDKRANIHYGEMILPNRVASAVRSEMARGKSGGGPYGTSVVINLTVQRATDREAVWFASRVKSLIHEDDELMNAGQGTFR